MEQSYKITLITPTYNAQDYLMKAFDSVKAQTIGFENIQYILYDDCSTDATPQMIDALAEQYPNVIARHMEKNSGNAGAPRNAAMRLAKADYIMFLDNDDALFPDACRALYEAIQQPEVDIASGFWRARAKEGSVFGHENREFANNVRDGVYSLQDCEFEVGHFFANDFWTKIYKRSILDEFHVEFNEGNMLEDLAFLYQYLVHCQKCRIVETGVIDYYVRDDSHGHDRRVSFFTQMPISLDFTRDKVSACGQEEYFFELIGRYCLVEYAIDMMMRARDFDRAQIKQVLQSWQDWLKLAHEKQFNLPSSYAKILARVAGECDIELQVDVFESLRALYWQRKTQLDDIFASTTWKLAQTIQKLKFW